MTSAQTLLASHRRSLVWLGAMLLLLPALTGCQSNSDRLVAPNVLTAPYDTSRGDVLWAVVPLRNESGTTVVDRLAVSDTLIAVIQETRGLSAAPLNRTIEAMRSLEMNDVASPADVGRLAAAMGVDGIVVGSITAYDPYNPPTLGLALALYSRGERINAPGIDALEEVRRLQAQPTEFNGFGHSSFETAPSAAVSIHRDAHNHDVLMDVQRYATGRHDASSATGWRRYLASMDLYTKYAAWHALGSLLDNEWIRLSRPTRLENLPRVTGPEKMMMNSAYHNPVESHSADKAALCCVHLRRGAHTWTFVADVAGEYDVLRSVLDYAERDDLTFDHFDASIVARQMARGLRRFVTGAEDATG